MGGLNPVLVITDGSVAGLLASAAAAQSGGGAIWTPAADPDTYLARRKAADRGAALYGLSVLGGPTIADSGEGDWANRMLLEACILARQSGVSSVVWTVTAGQALDLDHVSTAVDRALLVGRLASVGETRAIEVRAPYVDYTDRQLADLVLDTDLPIWTCWWYDAAGNAAAEREREHWARLLKDAGWEGSLPGPELEVPKAAARPVQ